MVRLRCNLFCPLYCYNWMDIYQVEHQYMQCYCLNIFRANIICTKLQLYLLVGLFLGNMYHIRHCHIYSLLSQLNMVNMRHMKHFLLNIYRDGKRNIADHDYHSCKHLFCNQFHIWDTMEWRLGISLVYINVVFQLLNLLNCLT